VNLVLVETVLLPLVDSTADANRGPSLRVEPLQRELRIRRQFSPSPSGRTWWLDVAVTVPLLDPEQVLRECEDFVVDSIDEVPLGIVDAVERDEETGFVSALRVAAGWFGRHRISVAAEAIELIVPAAQRIVVRVPPGGFPEADEPLS
jgi:hypothetical protein